MRTLAFYAVLIALVAACLEGTAYLAGRILARRGLVYVPQVPPDYEDYLARRDPLLGWPPPDEFGSGEWDTTGSRIVPSFPRGPSCLAAFGDSFTWGSEVSPADSYPNRLSERLGCRVSNYGVSGYGTDQAFLRYRDRIEDDAGVVVLAHYSAGIIRNVTRYRAFQGGSPHGFKPRFRMRRDRQLEFVPLPRLSADELAAIDRRPSPLGDDYFFPDGGAVNPSLRPPYALSVLSLLRHHRVRARFADAPAYIEFYRPSHPSGSLEITTAILRAFVHEATARGQLPLVILIPDERDLLHLHRHGRTPYAPLVESLARAGIDVPGIAERLYADLRGGGEAEIDALYVGRAGHLTPAANARLARIIAEWMDESGITPRADWLD